MSGRGLKPLVQAMATAIVVTTASLPVVCAQNPTTLPEITVTAPRSGGLRAPDQGSGTGTGDRKAFEKLNHELKRKVDEINPVINAPPLDARSPDTKIGIINIPAVQQQYGKNFGQSAIPYRPPSPVYAPPLGRR